MVFKCADRKNITEPTFWSRFRLGGGRSTSWQVRQTRRNTCRTPRLLTAFLLSPGDGTCLPVVFRYLGPLPLIYRVLFGWLGLAWITGQNCGELPSLLFCQGGPVVELLSGQGKDPVARWKLSGGPAAIQKVSELHSCSAAGDGGTLLRMGHLLSNSVTDFTRWTSA